MTRTNPVSARGQRGQALVMVAIAMVALVAMVGLIIDGGNAWAQVRETQNATDASANAGAVALVQKFGGANPGLTNAQWDAVVAAAVADAASRNHIDTPAAVYTDASGQMLTAGGIITTDPSTAAAIGGGVIPDIAQGVRASGSKVFRTYFAGIIGMDTITTTTDATSIAGALGGVLGGVLPVTFPVQISTCDGSSKLEPGTDPWPLVSPDDASASNESIVPLCKNGPGSVGWLDFGTGNMKQQIQNPSQNSFDIPTWLHTQTGNDNSLDADMNAYAGQEILIPLFDGTCKNQPVGTALGDCTTGEGTGDNTYYHIPKFASFLLQHAYIQGSNPECNQAPGKPAVGGNGSTGCLKGWFTKYITQGPVLPGIPNTSDPAVLGVQLIH